MANSVVQLCPQIHLLSCENVWPPLSLKLFAVSSGSGLIALPVAVSISQAAVTFPVVSSLS